MTTEIATVAPLSVTLDDILSWGPCYEYSCLRLKQLGAGRERITALEILDLPIPVEDRLWAVLREELIPAPILQEFVCRCNPDARYWPWGKISARDVSREAAWDAALAAARAAALAAAWDVDWAAVWAAAWARQIEDLRGLLSAEGRT